MTVNGAWKHVAAALAAAAIACGGAQDDSAVEAGGGISSVRTTALSDQLDGFDTSTWQKANWANGNPFNCGFLPDHVAFSGGAMSLKLDNVASSGKAYSCGEYRTNDTFGYGRFEVRMRAAKASGTVSSFFVYTGSPWDEIDVEILGKNTNQVQFNYYVNGVGGHERLVDLGFDASADYHTYAFDWQAGSISWYVDGVLKHSVSGGTLPSHPAQIMMNLWNGIGVDGWLGGFSYPGPLYAYYDYVTYTPAGGGGGGGTSGGRLVSAQSGRCLDVSGMSQANGAKVQIWDCNGQSNQSWALTSSGALQVYGNKCLDIPNRSTSAGTKLQIWDCNGQSNQQWRLNGDGTITSVSSGMCLDVVGAATANGTAVEIWPCNGGQNQKWSR